MKVYLAADHAGFSLKEALKPLLSSLGHEVEDRGASTLDNADDYPALIAQAARAVSLDASARAIILGGSGTGEAIVANRFPHVRAATYYGGPLDVVKLAREHNDSNVLSLGARLVTAQEAADAVRAWLETPFSDDERHARRITQIEEVSRI